MGSHKLLSKDETDQLILRAQAGDDAAMDKLVECNRGLIYKVALRQVRMDLGMTLDDCLQEGVIGLILAVQRFDVSRGLRLSTYAMYWIKQSMTRARDTTGYMVRLPVHRISRGEQPFKIESLDEPIHGFESKSGKRIDLIGNEEASQERDFLSNERAGMVREAVSTLPLRYQTILRMRFGLDGGEHTLEEVGRILKLSRERVRQLEEEALIVMRRQLSRLGNPDRDQEGAENKQCNGMNVEWRSFPPKQFKRSMKLVRETGCESKQASVA